MQKKLLILILLLHITAWFALKPVWPFSDDYCYTYNAHSFLEGHLNLTYDQFQNRFGVYIPTSIIFFVFGINPYTIALWPLLLSCFIITIVFLFLNKTTNVQVAFIASFLIAVNTMQITYSIALFPDLIVSFYCIASIVLLYYGRQYEKKVIYPFLINVILLLGFLTKETILLVMPFILLIFVYDILKKQNYFFWKKTILLALASMLLLLTFYYLITGDAFFRIKSMLAFNNTGFFDEYSKAYIKAIFSSNILKWFNSELGYLFILIFAAYSFPKVWNRNFNDLHSYIALYSLVLLSEFIFLFHTEKYGVLFMVDRLWILTVAPLSILSAFLIFKAKRKIYYYLMIIFTALIVCNYSSVSVNRTILFGFFLSVILFSYFMKQKNKNWNLLLLLPFLILAANFVYSNSNYRVPALRSSNLIKTQIEELNLTGKKIILTDSEFAENHIIYNGFKEYSNLVFYPFSKYDSLNHASSIYVIVNSEKCVVPDFVIKNANQWNKEYDKGKLLIYKKIE